MAAVEGKFTGRGYVIEDKGEVHKECYEAWQIATAPKCFFCQEPVN